MHNWISILDFFARLTVSPNRREYLLHENPDISIVDSFNDFMVGNKKPNQNHHLITHLARPLNMRKILTTNFDSLLELAFQKDNQAIKAISIDKNGRLPKDHLVNRGITIIKLHGTHVGTRSDYSLNLTATYEEEKIFSEYFSSFTAQELNKVTDESKCHLLIAGTSLVDLRTRQLIKSVIRKYKKMKVYIITNTEDKDKKNQLKQSLDSENSEKIIFSPPQNSVYCLYELYQRLVLSLPPGGFYYQYSQYVPPIIKKKLNKNLDYEELTEKIAKILGVNKKQTQEESIIIEDLSKYGILITKDKSLFLISYSSGITVFSIRLFEALTKKFYQNSLWYELEDYSHSFQLASEIVQGIFYEIGRLHDVQFDFNSFNFQDENETNKADKDGHREEKKNLNEFKERLGRYIQLSNINPSNWIIFLYSVGIPGALSGLSSKADINKFDNTLYESINKNNIKLFEIIRIFKELGFVIVFISGFIKNPPKIISNTPKANNNLDKRYC